MHIIGMDTGLIFGWLVSIPMLILVLAMMQKIVVEPMQEAVKIRGHKVQSRLMEAAKIAADARALEAKYRSQFSKLPEESEEMREATRREIDRNQQRLAIQAESDAAHEVAKAGREAEKYRVDVLAEIQHRTTALAIKKVESLLTKTLDSQAQGEMAEHFVGKVAQLRAS